MIYASQGKLCEKLKNSIQISIGQGVQELLIKTCEILFQSVTQEPLAY